MSRSRFTMNSLLLAMLAGAFAGQAHAGAYAGHTALTGQQTIDWNDDSAGTVPLARQGERLLGDRTYAGFRFGSGLGVEGMQYQTPARDLNTTTDTVGLAGTLSLPLADRLTATAKAGVHVSESSLALAMSRATPIAPQKLLGLGVTYRARQNLDLVAESQRLEGRTAQSISALPAQTFSIGARVQF